MKTKFSLIFIGFLSGIIIGLWIYSRYFMRDCPPQTVIEKIKNKNGNQCVYTDFFQSKK